MFAFVLLGMVAGALLGFAAGTWLGGIATRGCLEMDCLSGLFWTYGGFLLGALAGGIGGGLGARRNLRTHGSDARR
jgi:hypothetical protein